MHKCVTLSQVYIATHDTLLPKIEHRVYAVSLVVTLPMCVMANVYIVEPGWTPCSLRNI